jgi:hypothetical protein
MTETDTAKALGWASVGIALTEIVGRRVLEKKLDLGRHPTLLRSLGLRELASGVGILSQDDPTPWVWSRVAGDVMDLALLAAAARRNRRPGWLGFATVMVLGITALDVMTAVRLSKRG